MNKTSSLGLLTVLVILALAPIGAVQADTGQASITTYTIPFWFMVQGNATVANGTTTTINMSMPYSVSPQNMVLHYKLTYSNGTLVSDASNVQLSVTVNNGTQLTTVLLSSGSPAEADIPLSSSGVSSISNISVAVQNPLSDTINANVTITVLDQATFQVSLSPSSNINIPAGGTATVHVTITQTGGPSGTLFFSSTVDNSKITSTVTPSQLATSSGSQLSVDWAFTVDKSATSGSYHASLTGVFQPDNIPGILSGQATYTFAEVALPIAVEAAGAGLAGFSLGALAGASIGYWAAAIGIIFLFIVLLFVIMGRR